MDSIGNVLDLICGRLNEFFQNLDRRNGDWVILSNLTDNDSQFQEQTRNKIVMSLAGINHETVIATYDPAVQGRRDQYAIVSPPLHVTLNLMFMANFQGAAYRTGLTAISRTISYFQQNPWFNHENLPGLDTTVDKITLDFVSLCPADLSYVLGMMGARYLPSVFYKLRLIPFRSGAMQAKATAVKGMGDPEGVYSVRKQS